ncbi:MAG: dihydrofolate reductase [Myxococcota bacterium]
MRITLVAALDRRRVIGRGPDIPWRLPDDQRAFKRLTTGHCLVMGRATFESIGRPLPDRTSIVLTRRPDWRAEGALVAADLEAALSLARDRGETECFVVGGAAVYAAALPLADRMVLTRVDAEVEGDVHFPVVDFGDWRLVSEDVHPADARHAFPFAIQDWLRDAAAPDR